MLRSCRYCGRIHDSKFDCGKKPEKAGKKYKNQKNDFRSTKVWQRMREEIRERDGQMCQCCIRMAAGTVRRINPVGLSVHHIIPLEDDYERRLEKKNLITLCAYHHEQAEKGAIKRTDLLKMAAEQEKNQICT